MIALVTGTVGELPIGLYLVVPVLAGGVLSCLGLLRELLATSDVPKRW